MNVIDKLIAFFCLLVFLPLVLVLAVLVFLQDGHSPLYLADRVGLNGRIFKLFKLRSMRINADKTGVFSTSDSDNRITRVGAFIRRFKLDEITQMLNVLIGDMTLVGPRPNVKSETDLYTENEKKLLTVKPGVTDFASIVFSDEGYILSDSKDPDRDYNIYIRPWKSRLALLNMENRSAILGLQVLFLTFLSIVKRDKALILLGSILKNLGADEELIEIASRRAMPKPGTPP